MSSEKDFSPLSAACVRALNDKLYEKRKAAALEIEKMVKEFVAVNNTMQIKRLLKVLGQDFTNSQNPHTRKGGLIGLAAVAVALGTDTSKYIDELVKPILACFIDTDLRVRYYACEALYNVIKVARGAALRYFSEIFSALSKLAADPDQNVKNGSELLDRLMKDIVTESSAFNVVEFMPLLRERIYTKNAFARQFVISWVSVLDNVPDIDLILLLPEILDGLFRILEDPTLEIKRMCETVLGEFLHGIKKDPSRVDFAGMINILILHAQASDELLQLTAITWIKEFVQLSGRAMLPFASGILISVLPCLSFDTDSRRNIKETAKAVNFSLMKLVSLEDDTPPPPPPTSTSEGGPAEGGGSEGGIADPPADVVDHRLDLDTVVDVLTKHLAHSAVPTKVSVLRWLHHLHLRLPTCMFGHADELFPVLLRALHDPSDQVVQHDIEVLAEIISPTHRKSGAGDNLSCRSDQTTYPYFAKFIVSLLKIFSSDKNLLEDRGPFIIRQLCVLLSSEDIYRTLSEILLQEQNHKFASIMIETLNAILLTSPELFELRTTLKDCKTKESSELFICLYKSWCHNPVATVALCLLTQNYEHVCDLIAHFAELEVTVEFLIEIDKLIQLIESPIFTYLRLELLKVPHNQHLVGALYGLLMLLPQTEAFHTLRRRLDCVPSLHLHCSQMPVSAKEVKPRRNEIDFDKLLEHFIAVQQNHTITKQTNRTLALLEKGVLNVEL